MDVALQINQGAISAPMSESEYFQKYSSNTIFSLKKTDWLT